ncbi:MAG TPA: extracellular solute-binding protein [Gaiellales bacterium]|nr:extracellular solute-binding protein [Gaiellales bacterium]
MRRIRLLTLGALVALLTAAGCGGGSSSSSGPKPSSQIDKTPVTIVLWDMWSGREAQPFKDALKRFQVKYPWITIKEEVQPNGNTDTFDPNLVNAINGGNPPDVAMPFGPDYVGQYCAGGLWEDLGPFMKADGLSIDDFAPGAITYTNVDGKQCALPSLTDAYGLYYNKDMFAKAGISGPPKTMDELMADAKKLTVRNSDGSIKVAGFVPLDNWEQLGPGDLANAWGAKWFDSSGKPQFAEDPGWAAALRWQKQLIDWYGYDNITKFYAANNNNEFNPSNAFENGKVAMMFDGEWRTAFIADDKHPPLNYDTAPFPAASDHPEMYGPARVGGTIVGIPKGAKHPAQAWLLTKFLASDTTYLVQMANTVNNVPTTPASQSSPDLSLPPQFTTFLHVWANPKSGFAPPTTPSGNGYANHLDTLDGAWQAGKISDADLQSELQKLDQQVANELAQGSGP